MSLTLHFEDEKPDLFIIKIMSQLQPHELVYHLNNETSTNFIKEAVPFRIKRRGLNLDFQWFTHKIDDENEDYFVSNITYINQVITNRPSLFDNQEEIETKQLLLPSSKKFQFHLLSLSKTNSQILKPLLRKRIIQNFELSHINELKKLEQSILQNIHYEKQS